MKIILPDADWEEIERLARNRIDEDADTEQIASEALHGCAILARALLPFKPGKEEP